jgi:hypothetical protein
MNTVCNTVNDTSHYIPIVNMSDTMEHQSDMDNDDGAVSDQTNNGRRTRSSKSSTVMLASDKVKSMEQDMKKLFNHQHASNKYMKDVKAQLNQIMTALKQLPTDASITTTTTSSSSSQSHRQQQHDDTMNDDDMFDHVNDLSADDSHYLHTTQPVSFNTPSSYRPSSIRKRGRHQSSSDTSYDFTSDDDIDNDSDVSHNGKRSSKSKRRSSPNIHHARIRAIKKLSDSDIRIFNPALQEHSKASDAPVIKTVQVLRNCIPLMMQLVVKYHSSDVLAMQGAVNYLAQLDRICMEYSNDACVADLLDLDMHCRRRAGKWRYSDDTETVRRLMRQLHNKMISSTPIDRERAYNGGSKFTPRQRNNTTSYGKSASHTSSRPRVQPCYRWNGKDKSGVWTATSQCDRTDDACTYSHVCSRCHGGHQRFSKDGCKASEHDGGKRDSK